MTNIVFATGVRLSGSYESEKREMMNGNYGGGWMGGGGWMMIVGVLVCIVIIGVVVWLVMYSLKNKQMTLLSPLPQQYHLSSMNETAINSHLSRYLRRIRKAESSTVTHSPHNKNGL